MDILIFQNPLKFDIMKAPDNLQLELIDLQSNNFDENNLITFYSNLSEHKFPSLRNSAKSIICIFSSTYLCEQAFSRLRINLNISVSQTQTDLNEYHTIFMHKRRN